MPDFIIRNKSDIEIDPKILEKLKSKISRWQKENDFPVCVLIKRAETARKYSFQFEKQSWEKLEEGVQHNLLKATVDNILKSLDDSCELVEFVFYVGFSVSDFEKMMNKKNIPGAEGENRLSVSPTEPKYSLSQIVLPEETADQIKDVISLLKNIDKIYYDWGFVDIDPVPRSIVNFWGPPGTGKTMTAHAIANEMNKKIMVLNYADIESKYVGEAPKNLIAAFDKAEKEDSVIFFDEADSFLGKRITNISSGSEQAINSLRSQMLMKLEEFRGIVFFATNLHENYDKAFESRILKHIEFKLPNLEARKAIIAGKLPTRAPYSPDVKDENGEINDELLTQLSESIEGFSGREIKNCILNALVKVAGCDGATISSETLIESFREKKEEVEALKRKEEEKRQKFSKSIKENIDNKNYNTTKIEA